jgi:hypothetical protein
MPGKITDLADKFKEAGTSIINALWNGMKNAGTVIKDLAGDIYNAIAGRINAGIDIINDKIPDSIGKGPLKVDLPDDPFPHLPMFYKGGLVKGSKDGTLAIVGDRYQDEWIVPKKGPNGIAGSRNGSMNNRSYSMGGGNTFIFNGDLSFPNVKSGDDVETLISNLENLAS